jgi:hypothetical protein
MMHTAQRSCGLCMQSPGKRNMQDVESAKLHTSVTAFNAPSSTAVTSSSPPASIVYPAAGLFWPLRCCIRVSSTPTCDNVSLHMASTTQAHFVLHDIPTYTGKVSSSLTFEGFQCRNVWHAISLVMKGKACDTVGFKSFGCVPVKQTCLDLDQPAEQS